MDQIAANLLGLMEDYIKDDGLEVNSLKDEIR